MVKVDFHLLNYSAATDKLIKIQSRVQDYMLQNYNNLINSDVICCQK